MGAGASVLNGNRGILLTYYSLTEGYVIRYGFRLDLIGGPVADADVDMEEEDEEDLQAYDSDDITVDYDYDAGVEQ